MRCIIVGADRLGKTPEYLAKKFGVTRFWHWNGRQRKLPSFPKADMVVILTGFVNHGLMFYVKTEAKKRNIKIVYLKRGKSELEAIA